MTLPTPSTAAPGRRAVIRGALLSGALGAGAAAARPGSARAASRATRPVAAQPITAGAKTDADVLVVLTLRGGLDGLAAVVPADDGDLQRLRPTLAVPTDLLLGLDSTFGLHPALHPLRRWWRQGALALVHAVGRPGGSRSHQVARAETDRGAGKVVDGWLHRAFDGDRPWDSVFLGGPTAPGALAGSRPVALRSAAGFDLDAFTGPARGRWLDALTRLGAGSPELRPGYAGTVAAMRAWPRPEPVTGSVYPDSDLARSLAEAANVVRADLGTRVICLEHDGWDLHTEAGPGDAADAEPRRGRQAALLAELAEALDAFADDLGPDLDRVTLVTLTEFGRRADENGSGGTDHGSAGLMLLLGGGVDGGGRVAGDWPGLAADQLDRGGLKVTTDQRQVLAEVLQRRCGIRPDTVFPDLELRPLDVTHAR